METDQYDDYDGQDDEWFERYAYEPRPERGFASALLDAHKGYAEGSKNPHSSDLATETECLCSCRANERRAPATLHFEEGDGTTRVFFASVGLEPEDDFRAWSRKQTEAFMHWLAERPWLDDHRVIPYTFAFQGALEEVGRHLGSPEQPAGPVQALEWFVANSQPRGWTSKPVHVQPLRRPLRAARRVRTTRRLAAVRSGCSPGRPSSADDPEHDLDRSALAGVSR